MSSQNSSFMKVLGQKIRRLREERGLLLREVAASIEIDQALLSKIERGERKATKSQIVALAKYFGIQERELLTDWLGERIAYEILEEHQIAEAALKVAEQTFKYLKNQTPENN